MKYIRHNGQWVPATAFTRPPRVFPSIIRDAMEPVQSQADGRLYDSKSALRAAYRDQGYVELGNDAPRENAPFQSDPHLEGDIAQAWQMLEQGYRPEPTDTLTAGEFASVETRIL